MQKYVTAIVALLSSAEAVRVKDGDKNRIGAIMGAGPINDDYHLVTASGQEPGAFQEWVASNNKSYATAGEMDERLKNFVANNRAIREHNEAAQASGIAHPAMFNHNTASDSTEAERAKQRGLGHMMENDPALAQARAEAKAAAKAKAKARTKSKVRSTVMNDGMPAGTHDWTWASLPVMQQGWCGSCWAFTGVTVLEATEYVGRSVNDSNAEREELSFQMPVDCVDNCYGCNGGWVDRFNAWMVANGVQSRDSYPYVEYDQNCQSTANDRKMGFALSESTIWSVDDAVELMARGPLGGYFAVGDGFSWYSSGLIRTGDGNCLPVGTITNHAMAVVGVDLVGEGSVTTSDVEVLHARWADAGGCDESAGEFEWSDYPDFCLWWETEEQEDIVGEGAYWKIQNSWGADWGHEGFAYFAMEEDESYGPCGLYDEGMFVVGTASNPLTS